jgi:hypothetical protein
MTHLPFIAASYALGILVPAGFALSAFLRLGAARRRLAAIDPRVKGAGAKGGGASARSRAGSGARPGADQGAGREAVP